MALSDCFNAEHSDSSITLFTNDILQEIGNDDMFPARLTECIDKPTRRWTEAVRPGTGSHNKTRRIDL